MGHSKWMAPAVSDRPPFQSLLEEYGDDVGGPLAADDCIKYLGNGGHLRGESDEV